MAIAARMSIIATVMVVPAVTIAMSMARKRR
jgi:hypothetical protein